MIAGFFVWMMAQMGTFADEVLGRVKESLQASELLLIDEYVYNWTENEHERPRAPKDQAEFEAVVRDWTEAKAGRNVTRDRWDRPYVYDPVAQADPRHIVWRISSMGPDCKLGTADDLVVERDGDRATINRDPAKIAEEAIERKQRLDTETVSRVREILAAAKAQEKEPPAGAPPQKDVSPERQARELDEAVRDLGRILEQ